MTTKSLLFFLAIFGHYIFTSQASCSSNQYKNKSTATCQSCDPSCTTCFGPSSNHCSSCQSGMSLNNGTCLCPAGDYFHVQPRKCQSCQNHCTVSCTGPSSSDCSTCLPTTQFEYLSSCYTLCTVTQYFDTGLLSCQPCNPNCYSCTGPGSNQCTTYTVAETLPGAPICDSSCHTCSGSSANQCNSCQSNLTLVNGTCTTGSNSTGSGSGTVVCDSSCLTCSGSSTNQCNSCQSNLTLVNGTCITESSSVDCDHSCLTCSGSLADQCLSCQPNLTLVNGSCINGSNSTGSGPSTIVCDNSCLTCSGSLADQCLSCQPNLTFNNGSCINTSSPQCTSLCQTCEGSSEVECTSCIGNNFFLNIGGRVGSCYSTCPDGYYGAMEGSINMCLTQLSVQVRATRTSDQDKFTIGFDINVEKIYTDLVSEISIQIQPQAKTQEIEYEYSFSLSDSQKEINVQLILPDYVPPSNILTISLPNTFSMDSTVYVFDKLQSNFVLQEQYDYSDFAENFISVASSFTQGVSEANGIYSIFSSTAFKSLHSIRSELIDSILTYFIFMNVQFPPNFVDFALGNLQADDMMKPSIFNNLVPQRPEDESLEPAPCDVYLSGRSFFQNYGNDMTQFIILLSLVVFFEIVLKLVPLKFNKKHWLVKTLTSINYSMRWNTIVGEFISGSQTSTYYSLLALVSLISVGDAIAAGICLGITIIAFIAIYMFEKKVYLEHKQTEKKEENVFLKRLAILYDSLKPERLTNLIYFNLLLLRSFGFSVCLVFAVNAPVVQLIYLLIATSALIFYLIKFRPIKQRLQLFVTILYEVLLLTGILVACALHGYNQNHLDDIDKRNGMGFVLIIIGVTMMGVNVANFFVEIFHLWHTLYRRKKVHIIHQNSIKIQINGDQERLRPLGSNSPLESPTTVRIIHTKDEWPVSPKSDEVPSDAEIIKRENSSPESSKNGNNSPRVLIKGSNNNGSLIFQRNNSRHLLLKFPSETKNLESKNDLLAVGEQESMSQMFRAFSGFQNSFRSNSSEIDLLKKESLNTPRKEAPVESIMDFEQSNPKSLLGTGNLRQTLSKVRLGTKDFSPMIHGLNDVEVEDYQNGSGTPKVSLLVVDKTPFNFTTRSPRSLRRNDTSRFRFEKKISQINEESL